MNVYLIDTFVCKSVQSKRINKCFWLTLKGTSSSNNHLDHCPAEKVQEIFFKAKDLQLTYSLYTWVIFKNRVYCSGLVLSVS